MASVKITPREEKAIKALKALAKTWPKSLNLFSHSGTLCVTKEGSEGIPILVDSISGIRNDGGDPSADELDQFGEVFWP
jgi:hypothetical protein